MAIRYEDLEGRKRVAIEALKSTGAKRVFAGEAAPAVAAVPAARKRERRPAVAPAPAKTAETRFDRKDYQKVYMRAYMRAWRARKASERAGAGNRPPGDLPMTKYGFQAQEVDPARLVEVRPASVKPEATVAAKGL